MYLKIFFTSETPNIFSDVNLVGWWSPSCKIHFTSFFKKSLYVFNRECPNIRDSGTVINLLHFFIYILCFFQFWTRNSISWRQQILNFVDPQNNDIPNIPNQIFCLFDLISKILSIFKKLLRASVFDEMIKLVDFERLFCQLYFKSLKKIQSFSNLFHRFWRQLLTFSP